MIMIHEMYDDVRPMSLHCDYYIVGIRTLWTDLCMYLSSHILHVDLIVGYINVKIIIFW